MKLAALAGLLLCCTSTPKASIKLGRGAISDTSLVSVTAVSIALATTDYNGKRVQAGPGYKYVLLDCRLAAAANAVSFDDFQLIRDRDAKLGEEVNLGDDDDARRGYLSYWGLYWAPSTWQLLLESYKPKYLA